MVTSIAADQPTSVPLVATQNDSHIGATTLMGVLTPETVLSTAADTPITDSIAATLNDLTIKATATVTFQSLASVALPAVDETSTRPITSTPDNGLVQPTATSDKIIATNPRITSNATAAPVSSISIPLAISTISATSARVVTATDISTSSATKATRPNQSSAAAVTTRLVSASTQNLLQSSTRSILSSSTTSATTPVSVNQSEYKRRRTERDCLFSFSLSLFYAHHHTHPNYIITFITVDISTRPRDFHHLLPSAAMYHLTCDDSTMDSHSMHADLLLNRTATTTIGDHHSQRAVPPTENTRLWHLPADTARQYGGRTSVDVDSIRLCDDHTITHHTPSPAPWYIDDHPWPWARSSAQSRHLFHRSRCSHLQCQCEYSTVHRQNWSLML